MSYQYVFKLFFLLKIDKKAMKTSGMVTRVINEVEIHCQLKHPSILEVHVLHPGEGGGSVFATFGQIIYVIHNLVTFYLCMHLLNKEHFTFHLQYKHSSMFACREYKEHLTPKIRECATPS